MAVETHTPGPWEAKREDNTDRGWCVYDAIGMLVARRLTKANARLIAAAPDMLAALQAMTDIFDKPVRGQWFSEIAFEAALIVHGAALAAIAKASGRNAKAREG